MLLVKANRQLILIALLLGLPAWAGFTGRVVSVADGDTVTVLTPENVQHKIRLLCIDAPEFNQAYGNASRKHLSNLIAGKTITVQTEERDKYGRVLGLIWLNGYDMNWQMIKDGYAWDYRRYSCGKSYRDAEIRARQAKRGLWRDKNPVPPWEFRNR